METVACNLCHATEASQLYTLPDYLLGRTDIQAHFVKCQACGLVYQNPRPDQAELAQYYPDDYECYNQESGSDDSQARPFLREKAVQYGIQKRCRFVTRHKQGGRLLDVGCATGIFLHGMAQHPGWELFGVEISPYASHLARQVYGLNVITGTLDRADFPGGFFDAITLWDVFEHLPDPASTLRRIHHLLKEGGLLVLRVPNLGGWDARLFGPYWVGFEPPRHLYVFDAHTLGQYLERTGFRVSEMTSASAGYTTFLVSLRFFMTGRGMQPATIQSVSRVLVHPIMQLLCAPLFYLGGLGLRGPQIVVLAHKIGA